MINFDHSKPVIENTDNSDCTPEEISALIPYFSEAMKIMANTAKLSRGIFLMRDFDGAKSKGVNFFTLEIWWENDFASERPSFRGGFTTRGKALEITGYLK